MGIQVPTAAILSIGDEVLRGDTVDTNSAFLARELTARGVQVTLMATIPDEHDVIVDYLRQFSAAHDHVLSCGGIGPTPDDKTRQAVAAAFGRELEFNVEALAGYARNRGTELNPGQREMCHLPAGCELIWGEGLMVPGFRVENVYVFPGVPKIMEAMWRAIAARFSGQPWHVVRFKTYTGESHWAHIMAAYMERYPQLGIGSYPKLGETWWSEVAVRGLDTDEVERAAAEFKAEIDALGVQPTPGN
jgi:molybdenum cofactor synthesis domain-containing protein